MTKFNPDQWIDSYLDKISTKQMLIIPLALLFFSLVILGWTFSTTGSPVELGVEFTGGTIVEVRSTSSYEAVEKEFATHFPATPPINARDGGGGTVKLQFGLMDESQHMEFIDYLKSNYGEDFSLKQMGAVYSENLQKSAIKAVILAFFGMAIIVCIIFRSFVPSAAVVLSAFSDIVIAATLMDLFGIPLSLGTVAALLMLIGYSVDSDILLTTRLLKRRGDLNDKLHGAMKTGLTMTSTTIAAIAVLFLISTCVGLISSYSKISIISEISIVLLFGLAVDLMNTWMLNSGILKWHIERSTPVNSRKRGRKR
ncbi:MAG: protein translocase subunit SecF [Methanosarcinales archaeon]|nr:protein translocase subunit SecF [Methanosarcinales archaeon]